MDEITIFPTEELKEILNNDIHFFKEKLFNYRNLFSKEWRDGQFVFNVIDDVFPSLGRYIQFEKHIDCFYDDSKIDSFLEEALSYIKDNIEFEV